MADLKATSDDSEKEASSVERAPSPFFLGPVVDIEEEAQDAMELQNPAESQKASTEESFDDNQQQLANFTAARRLLAVSSDTTMMTTGLAVMGAMAHAALSAEGSGILVRRTCSTSTLRLKKKRSEFWRKMTDDK